MFMHFRTPLMMQLLFIQRLVAKNIILKYCNLALFLFVLLGTVLCYIKVNFVYV